MKIKEDRAFLISQRQKYWSGSLFGINFKIFIKEERAIERQKAVEEKSK